MDTKDKKMSKRKAVSAKKQSRPKANFKKLSAAQGKGESLLTATRNRKQTKKVKRIVLHVGTRKTGSTAFQSTVRERQAALLEQGFSVVVPIGKSFKEFYLSLVSGTPIWRNLIDVAIDNAEQNQCDNILITSEDLYYIPQWKIAELIYYCESLAEKVDVVAFIRRQDSYLESSYSQYVTVGIWVGNIQNNFENFLNQTIDNIDHVSRIAAWKKVCKDNFNVIPYFKADTADYLLKYLSLDLKPANIGQVNRRKSLNLIRASVYIGEQLAQNFGLPIHRYSDINKHFDFRGKIRNTLSRNFAELSESEIYSYNLIKNKDFEMLAHEFHKTNSDILSEYGQDISSGFADFSGKDRNYKSLAIGNVRGKALEVVLSSLLSQLSGPK